MPLLSFAAGWLGFVLVSRGEGMARVVAALSLLGWLWLLMEPLLGGALARLTRGRLSLVLVRRVTQSLQQELLFFALAFLIGALQQDIGQMLFVGIVITLALASTLDPLYDAMTRHVSAAVGFHAFCVFLSGVVVLPIVLHLPLEQALPVALWLTAALMLACLPRLFAAVGPWRILRRVAWLGVMFAALWFSRAQMPAAGLVVQDARMTQQMQGLEPGSGFSEITAATLLSEGATAFIAVRAPMGLSQPVVFEWRHRQELLDRIAVDIRGGREGGYRTYSRKQNLPADPRGAWTVDVRTPQGQLITRLAFVVT